MASDAPREALTRILEAVERGHEPPGAALVKRSRARRVWRVRLADTAVYVKQYLVPSALEGIRFRLLRSRAAQEFRNLQHLRSVGVAAVAPLGCAERRRGVRLVDGVLVTWEVPAAVLLREELARRATVPRRALLDELARMVRRLHDHGLWHRDLHAGNVLVTATAGAAAGLVLVDVQKMRRLPGPVPDLLRVRDLSLLCDDLGRLTVGAERAALLATYAAAQPGRHPLAPLRVRVERATARRARARLRSRGRRCVVRSTGFCIERHGRQRVYRRADVPAESVLASLAAHRRILARGAQAPGFVSRREAQVLSRVEGVLGGPPAGPAPRAFARGQGGAEAGAPARAAVAVREFSEAGRRTLLATLVRSRHRGMRAWRNAHALLLRGFEVPAPLALVVERRLGLVRRSYYLTRWDEPTRAADAESSGLLRGRLCAAGVSWDENEPPRVLVRTGDRADLGGGGSTELLLVNPEAVRVR